MPDWTRKYLGDLAWVAKEYAHDLTLTPSQQEHFGRIYKQAKAAAAAPAKSLEPGMRETVAELCTVCRDADLATSECAPRIHWQAPCPLVSRRLLAWASD